jgi:hypothetical protein
MKTCSLEGCTKKHSARGMCNAHYCRWLSETRRSERPPVQPKPKRTCTHPGCTDAYYSNGLCRLHYARLRHGLPMDAPRKKSREGTCECSGCIRKILTGGLCASHYARKIKGDPEWWRPIKTILKRGAYIKWARIHVPQDTFDELERCERDEGKSSYRAVVDALIEWARQRKLARRSSNGRANNLDGYAWENRGGWYED